jgi:hypothetical protein
LPGMMEGLHLCVCSEPGFFANLYEKLQAGSLSY